MSEKGELRWKESAYIKLRVEVEVDFHFPGVGLLQPDIEVLWIGSRIWCLRP